VRRIAANVAKLPGLVRKPNLLMRRLIPPASDQEIQPKECYCRCTGGDKYYAFRVERIQGQIDEEICAHDDQSQGANQVDRSAHRSHRSPSTQR
jgi:hypothetical protein